VVAGGEQFSFPEGRVGLQEIHQESGRGEGGFAMGGSGDYENDVVPGGDPARPVDDGDRGHRPAAGGFLGNAQDLVLRHAGIVFEFQCRKASAFIATKAGEGDDGAGTPAAPHHVVDLRRKIEIFRLDAKEDGGRHLSRRSSAERERPP
jgi:hypothetical protein